MSWWLLVPIVIIAFLVLAFRSARAWRAAFRGEFIAYLRREAPEFEIAAERDRELDIRRADGGAGAGTLSLERLFREGTHIPAGDTAGKEAFFAAFVAMLREGRGLDSLDAQVDRARVFPRLLPDAFFDDVRARDALAAPATLPSGVPGLSIAFVLDSKNSVAYLTSALLADLKLSPEEALAVAKENLARSVDVALILRGVFEKRALMMVKSFDSYDAARVLLVPACLAEGQEVAAVIPDRDTLGLVLPPADGDWGKLRKLARTPAGDVLWPEPLRVTSAGIFTVPTAVR